MVDFGAGTNHWIEDYFGLSQVTCLTNQRVGISLKKSKSVAQVGTAMQTDFFLWTRKARKLMSCKTT